MDRQRVPSERAPDAGALRQMGGRSISGRTQGDEELMHARRSLLPDDWATVPSHAGWTAHGRAPSELVGQQGLEP